jgi:hypothetical protein
MSSRQLALSLAIAAAAIVCGLVVAVGGERSGRAPIAPAEPFEPRAQARPATVSRTPDPIRAMASPVAPSAAPTRTELPTARDAELAEAHWVEGRVVFPPDAPAGARPVVIARGRDFEHGPLHETTTEVDGAFRVAFSRRTIRGTLELRSRVLFLPRRVSLKVRDVRGPVLLEPLVGGCVRGTIEVAADSPLSRELLTTGLVELGSRTVPLGSDLQFELGGLDPEVAHRIRIYAERFEARWLDPIRVAPLEIREEFVTLDAGVVVAGIVVDSAGAPVAGAEVMLVSFGAGSNGSEILIREKTTRDGRFRFGGLAPRFSLSVTRKGYVRAKLGGRELARGDVLDDLVVRLERGNSLAGCVEWPDGAPASNADVRIIDESDESSETWRADRNGAFHATGLGPGTYRLEAKAWRVVHSGAGRTVRETQRGSLAGVAADSPGVLLTLGDGGAAFEGRVTDDVGAPIDSFTIRASPTNAPELSRVRLDVEGSRGLFRLEGLREGEWTITLLAGTRSSAETLMAVPGRTAPVHLVLPRLATLSITVVTPDGACAPGATIDVPRNATRVADAAGTVRIELEPGGTRVRAFPDDRLDGLAPSATQAVRLLPGAEVPIELALRRAATLTGTVVAYDGTPLAGHAVGLMELSGRLEQDVEADSNGRFAFHGLPPGTYRVIAVPAEVVLREMGDDGHAFEVDEDPLRRRHDDVVALEEGQSLEFTLAPSDAGSDEPDGFSSAPGDR